MTRCNFYLWRIAVLLLFHEFATRSVSDAAQEERSIGDSCPCRDSAPWPRPDVWKKAETARWMVHSIEWGVLTTLSTRTIASDDPSPSPVYPFGNVYSFIDGPCHNATGTPYFYGSFMDQSLKDILKNPAASLTLSEASLASSACVTDEAMAKACSISAPNVITREDHRSRDRDGNRKARESGRTSGDPESPLCARLTLTGTLEQVPNESEEFSTLQQAFFQRHAQMQGWPRDHEWVIFSLRIQDVWLIDYFGGASILTPDQYYGIHAPTTRDSND